LAIPPANSRLSSRNPRILKSRKRYKRMDERASVIHFHCTGRDGKRVDVVCRETADMNGNLIGTRDAVETVLVATVRNFYIQKRWNMPAIRITWK